MTDTYAIRARLEAATPGPWVRGHFIDGLQYRRMSEEWKAEAEARERTIIRAGGYKGEHVAHEVRNPADAEFIAHAPEDIRWLLNRVEEFRGYLIQANKDLERLTEQRDAARRKLAEAWYEGVDAALERRTQLTNPYLLPGEDGPR